MQNTKEILDELKLTALSLSQYETTYREICPFCGSNSGADRGSFSLTRDPRGIVFHCFRAKCGAHGFVPVGAVSGSLDYQPRERPEYEPKHFYKDLEPLPHEIEQMLWVRFGLRGTEMRDNGLRWSPDMQRVYFPVYNALGENTGAVLRDYTGVEKKKTLLYHWRPTTHSAGHWPRCVNPTYTCNRPVVLVEDIVSSIRVARHNPCVALIGTEPSVELIKYLVPRYRRVVLALDPDAYGRSMRHWRTFGLYFDEFKPIKLLADPKDLSHEDLTEVLDCV